MANLNTVKAELRKKVKLAEAEAKVAKESMQKNPTRSSTYRVIAASAEAEALAYKFVLDLLEDKKS